MAFSFGGSSGAASTPSFSFAAASTAASSSAFSFAGASTPATPFGGATNPAFGQQQSSPSLFGGTSTPAYGGTAVASTPSFGAASGSLFGATSTPAFGAASGSLFGAASTSAFSVTGAFGAPSASLFGSTTTPSLFGTPAASTAGALTAFQTPSAQSQPAFGSAFGGGGLLMPAQQPPQLQQLSAALCGTEGKPLTHYTKWEDISPQGQSYLLELEKVIMQSRDECRQLDDNTRLWGDEGPKLKQDMAEDEQALGQALSGLEAALKGDLHTIAAFREKAVTLLHDTELAVRTFQRAHRWRQAGKVLPGQVVPPGVREQLNGPIVLPSQYLRRATHAFQDAVGQYRALVSELEGLLPPLTKASDTESSALSTLPLVLHNLHDFFNHVAARLEKLHDGVAAAKQEFLERRREAGNYTDPFAEAERKYQLRRMAAHAKLTVIPPSTATPGIAQPPASTPAAAGGGLFGASTPSLFGTSTAPAATPASGGLFGTATPAAWNTAASTPANGSSSTRRGRRK